MKTWSARPSASNPASASARTRSRTTWPSSTAWSPAPSCHAHDEEGFQLDSVADAARAAVQASASLAQLQLDNAAANADLAITQAANSAYGLINADDLSAAARIGTVVDSLVAGHLGAYKRRHQGHRHRSRRGHDEAQRIPQQRRHRLCGRGAADDRRAQRDRAAPHSQVGRDGLRAGRVAGQGKDQGLDQVAATPASASLGCGFRESLEGRARDRQRRRPRGRRQDHQRRPQAVEGPGQGRSRRPGSHRRQPAAANSMHSSAARAAACSARPALHWAARVARRRAPSMACSAPAAPRCRDIARAAAPARGRRWSTPHRAAWRR